MCKLAVAPRFWVFSLCEGSFRKIGVVEEWRTFCLVVIGGGRGGFVYGDSEIVARC
jgi:hypothetical protein